MNEPIAVIGRACHLPGIDSPEELWQAISAQRDLTDECPDARWRLNTEAVLNPKGGLDRTVTNRGGYLSKPLPPEAKLPLPESELRSLDPLFQWTLCCASEALEDAGIARDQMLRTGAIMGNLSYPSREMSRASENIWLGEPADDVRNIEMSFGPVKILSKALGLGGPCFALDAACASSLYAIRYACDVLNDGKADIMISGAVNMADDLFIHMGFTALKALSPTGQSRPFDREADGLLPAEGVAFVILERLSDARANHHNILGVIRGIGLSNDGRQGGILAPSASGQLRALQAAYKDAQLSPAEVSLLECHATGTPVGDKVELQSAFQCFGERPDLYLGSLKSNMGHLITAAGAAGLIKLLEGFRHSALPLTRPIAHPLQSPYPYATEPRPWMRSEGHPRIAAISAFGFGGNNAHLIVSDDDPTIPCKAIKAPLTAAPRIAALKPSSESNAIGLLPAIDAQKPAPEALNEPADFHQTAEFSHAIQLKRIKIEDPIVIAGIGVCAGGAENLQSFMQALERHQSLGKLDRVSIPKAKLRFPPRDLDQTLPQQLALVQAAIEALKDPEPCERASVFAGMTTDPNVCKYGLRWRQMAVSNPPGEAELDAIIPALQSAGVVGCMPNIVANRLNAWFDWGGPSAAISEGRLSGIEALMQAKRALKNGEIDHALVCAVDLRCDPVFLAAKEKLAAAKTAASGDKTRAPQAKTISSSPSAEASLESSSPSCDAAIALYLTRASIAGDRAIAKLEDESDAPILELPLPDAGAADALLKLAAALCLTSPGEKMQVLAGGTQNAGQKIAFTLIQKPAANPQNEDALFWPAHVAPNVSFALKNKPQKMPQAPDLPSVSFWAETQPEFPRIEKLHEAPQTAPLVSQPPKPVPSTEIPKIPTGDAGLQKEKRATSPFDALPPVQTAPQGIQDAGLQTPSAAFGIQNAALQNGSQTFGTQNASLQSASQSFGIQNAALQNCSQTFGTQNADLQDEFRTEQTDFAALKIRARLSGSPFANLHQGTPESALFESRPATETAVTAQAPLQPCNANCTAEQTQFADWARIHRAFLAQQSAAHRAFLQFEAKAKALLLQNPAARIEDAVPQIAPRASATKDAAPQTSPRMSATKDAAPQTSPQVSATKDAAPQKASQPASSLPIRRGDPLWDRAQLEIHAAGKLSQIFGPEFAPLDDYPIRVRMPRPPLLLADRVLEIEGVPAQMGKGRIVTETDVSAKAWYASDNCMPAGVMIESGQADLLLISYLGVDFLNKGERAYRLLACDLTYSGGLPRAGDVLHYEISIDGHANHGDVRLFFFHYNCTVNGGLRLQVRGGQAGFFTAKELEESKGVLWDPPTAPSLDQACFVGPKELDLLCQGRIAEVFGAGFERAYTHTRSPHLAKKTALFHRAWIAPRYLKAEWDFSPADWFFDGHFHCDPCMPGTLMFEGCLQAMALYMLKQGYSLARDGWRFEPVRDQAYHLVCRGQATPRSHRLCYEIFVQEEIAGPQPAIFADLLVTIDGLKAFHAARMGLCMVPDWPLEQKIEGCSLDPRGAIAGDHVFNLRSLLATAWGRPSEAFGKMYAPFDGGLRVARLPGPPYHFLSRVEKIEGEPAELKTGARTVIAYDVPSDAWYFKENGAPVMPFCVFLEVALQPCGWLASYVGSALGQPKPLAFRNLDGSGAVLSEIQPGTETLHTDVTLTKVAKSGDMIIEGFDVILHQGSRPIYSFNTVFGFFPDEAFQNQPGLPCSPEDRAFLECKSDFAIDLRPRPSRYFENSARLPRPMLCMLDRVTGYWPKGGKQALGAARGEKDVNPQEWFFKAHFFQDPVQPGSLGLEALLQLLQFCMLEMQLDEGLHAPRFEPIALGETLTWKYRGQVIPENKVICTVLELTSIERDAHCITAHADGALYVDGKRIYEAKNLAMRLVEQM